MAGIQSTGETVCILAVLVLVESILSCTFYSLNERLIVLQPKGWIAMH